MGQQRVDVGFRTFQASTTIAKNLRVKLDSNLKLVVAGVNDHDIGFIEEAALAADDYKVVVLHSKPGTQFGVAAAAISKGAYVYPAASGKVTSINSGKARWIAATAATADGDIIELIPYAGSFLGGAITAASTAIASSAVIGAFDQSVSVPANSLKAGDVLRIRAAVGGVGVTGTPTLVITLKFGTVTIKATAATTTAANDVPYIECDFVIRTATTAVASGITIMGVPGTGVPTPFIMASTTVDLAVANDITVSATWSASSASNTCRLDVLDVQKIIG